MLIHLVSCLATDKREIDWENCVTAGESDSDKELNAKYAISLAKKYGCMMFVVPEDIYKVNKKMLLIFMAAIYDKANSTNIGGQAMTE